MKHKQLVQTPGRIFLVRYTEKGGKTEVGFMRKAEGNAQDPKPTTRLVLATEPAGSTRVVKTDIKFKEFLAAKRIAEKSGEPIDITRKGLAESGAMVDAIVNRFPAHPKQNRGPSRLPG